MAPAERFNLERTKMITRSREGNKTHRHIQHIKSTSVISHAWTATCLKAIASSCLFMYWCRTAVRLIYEKNHRWFMTACIGRQCIGMNGHFFFVIMSYFLFRSVFFLFFCNCMFICNFYAWCKREKGKVTFSFHWWTTLFLMCVYRLWE